MAAGSSHGLFSILFLLVFLFFLFLCVLCCCIFGQPIVMRHFDRYRDSPLNGMDL
jgi:hypothetical protein